MMQSLSNKNYLYSYVPEGNILKMHESEYFDEYDFDLQDELEEDEDFRDENDFLDEMH